MPHFHTIVIGKGLVGSATAKYLSTDRSVALIGPDEPIDYTQASVFASHYDEARVQRVLGKDETWTRLNRDAVNAYRALEQQSGIQFHHPVGCLYVNPYGKDDYLNQQPSLSARLGLSVQQFPHVHELHHHFPNFHFPVDSVGIYETAPSGYIHPRKLIQAQVNLFQENKGAIISETVTRVEKKEELFHLFTLEGNHFSSQQVVVATGSFINQHQLLPQKLQLVTKSEVVLLVELSSQEAQSLADLPSLLYEINTPLIDGIYLIQPVQYPDGKYYLKMGANVPEDLFFERLEEIQHWFREADRSPYSNRLIEALQLLMPQLPIRNYQTKKCIISRTPHGRPYIGETPVRGWFVAGGCNGYSAMCSDAMGNVTAHLVREGTLPEGYAANAFELLFQP
ncbi:MAG: FAD-binding oxidoreductase [Bacteroidetes bacterium]|nr:FAD-binding oxidoreductase [Bacteroidota bacterium]